MIREAAMKLQLASLTGRGAHVIAWGFVLTIVIMALTSLDDVLSPLPTIHGLVIFLGVAVLLTVDRGPRLSLGVAIAVAVAWVVVALLISWQLTEPGGHAQWYYGAATVSLFYMGLRGRQLSAWLGYATISAVVAAAAVTQGFGPLTAALIIGKQLPIMLVSSLVSFGLARTTATIARLSTETAERAAAEAAHTATSAERNARLTELDEIATPLLQRLLSVDPPTDAERVEFAVAEAQLRDGLRARSLSTPEVAEAAKRARRRGIEVVLLDDRSPASLDPKTLSSVHERVIDALDTALDGRVVARLLPEGRVEVATILIDGEKVQRREVVLAD